MTGRRERVGWSLLFSVPVGVGVGLATSRMAQTTVTDPLVVATAAGFGAVLFALVWLATRGGESDDNALRVE